jgi:hypothetical protein
MCLLVVVGWFVGLTVRERKKISAGLRWVMELKTNHVTHEFRRKQTQNTLPILVG